MKRYQNFILMAAVVALVAVPLWTVEKIQPGAGDGEATVFSGADGQAKEMIGRISPAYRPWFKPLLQPPSGEIESLLFALQAAIGAGFIGYYLGASVTRTKLRRRREGE